MTESKLACALVFDISSSWFRCPTLHDGGAASGRVTHRWDGSRPLLHVIRGGKTSTYVCETLAAVEAHSLESAVAKHLDDLGVFLAVLLEGQLSALVIVLLGSSSAVLAALFCAKRKKSR
jgi:hypothetical protein